LLHRFEDADRSVDRGVPQARPRSPKLASVVSPQRRHSLIARDTFGVGVCRTTAVSRRTRGMTCPHLMMAPASALSRRHGRSENETAPPEPAFSGGDSRRQLPPWHDTTRFTIHQALDLPAASARTSSAVYGFPPNPQSPPLTSSMTTSVAGRRFS